MRTERQRLYGVWCMMRRRCSNPSSHNYKHYGARGIRVCERWMNDFNAFIQDMGPRPAGQSLDRINNDGNYEPSNCRWATPTEQRNNRRTDNEVLIEFNGKSQNQSAWEREYGLPRNVLRSRLVLGWTIERALTTPVRHWRKSEVHQRGFRDELGNRVGQLGGAP